MEGGEKREREKISASKWNDLSTRVGRPPLCVYMIKVFKNYKKKTYFFYNIYISVPAFSVIAEDSALLQNSGYLYVESINL